ncbi:sugar phosphate nucleotidyltransferase [candidate division KSB1 bacterium]
MIVPRKKQNIEWAVIPAAGLGTRMRKSARGIPKEMLEIGGKPVIYYTVREMLVAGIARVIIVVSPLKPEIREYVQGCKELTEYNKATTTVQRGKTDNEIIFVIQEKPLGLSHAVSLTEHLVGKNDFMVAMPDNFFPENPSPTRQLLRQYNPGRCCVALMQLRTDHFRLFGNTSSFEYEETKKPGVVLFTEMSEKQEMPATPGDKDIKLKGIGRTVYTRDFFEAFHSISHVNGTEFDDVPVFQKLVAQRKVDGCLIKGTAFDTGNPEGYRAAREWSRINAHKNNA